MGFRGKEVHVRDATIRQLYFDTELCNKFELQCYSYYRLQTLIRFQQMKLRTSGLFTRVSFGKSLAV
eukprot:4768240-Amphidinium_carterae.1